VQARDDRLKTERPRRRTEREVSSTEPVRALALQRLAGNRAVAGWLQGVRVQRDDEELDAGSDPEELQARPGRRTQDQARALVDAHVVPRSCFIELESARAGYRPISGTGCAHWVAHQRGGPSGTTNVCMLGFKYRVTELLASLYQASADLQGARVGYVWSASATSHVGIVRAVHLEDGGTRIVSVDVENDSSASGGVVTQNKTDGSIYA
jgi:hypothetical protein